MLHTLLFEISQFSIKKNISSLKLCLNSECFVFYGQIWIEAIISSFANLKKLYIESDYPEILEIVPKILINLENLENFKIDLTPCKREDSAKVPLSLKFY